MKVKLEADATQAAASLERAQRASCPFCRIVDGVDRPGVPKRDCFHTFHSQDCSGFGAAEFCPSCGETWKERHRALKGTEPEVLSGGVVFEPLHPVTEGHLLIVPRDHAGRLEELDEYRAARLIMEVQRVGRRMAEAGLDYNVIQSNGEAATQTVAHVHFHIVPRRPGDGLALPWTPSRADEW